MHTLYDSFDDLPPEFREAVLRVGEPDTAAWVLQPIPALDGRSLIDTMDEPGGTERVRLFLARVTEKFG